MSRRTVWAVRTLFLSAVLLVIAVPDAKAQCAVLNATPNPVTVNTPVSLTWSAPTAACTTPDQPTFTGYRVYVQVPGGGSFQQIGDTAPAVRNFQYTPTLTGSYQFRVTAVYTNAVCGACIITEGNSNTVTVNSQASCSYSIAPTSNSVPSTGGGGTIGVTTGTGCAWTAVSNSGFITVTGGASGSGNGTVSYQVAANNTGGARMGTLTVAGRTFTLTQAAPAACTYVLEPQSIDIGAGGGTGSFIVMTNSGCSWVAVSGSPFITVTSGASGTGIGTVSYSVQSNTGTLREGAITVGDIAAFRIRQAAAEARPARRRSVRH